MTALWTSFLVVVLAEMGDKTQLVAPALAARYRRPWTVMLGILLATTANHALAATARVWVSRLLPPAALAWGLALSFIAFGIWGRCSPPPPSSSSPRWATRPSSAWSSSAAPTSPGWYHRRCCAARPPVSSSCSG
jgi:putative Ca2+/H+ antiporter (TMEM165/GDT1 family)